MQKFEIQIYYNYICNDNMETAWHLSQINNNHPQVSVSKETRQIQFQQSAITFCADMPCSSDTVQMEVKTGFPVFENRKNIVTCSYL